MRSPVGKEYFIDSDDIVAILRPDAIPSRELNREAAEAGILIKATNGKKAGGLNRIDLKTEFQKLSNHS